MKNLGKTPRVPLLFEGTGAIPVNTPASESSNTRTLDGNDGDGNTDMLTDQSMEKLIPLDIEVEQLDFTHQKDMQCDRLSVGSDLSPEELFSENSLRMVSMEMMHHASQMQPLPPETLIERKK